MAFLRRNPAEDLMSNPQSSRPAPAGQTDRNEHDGSLKSAFATPRARKQLGLFFAGATFFTLSTFITRKALHRRYLATIPRFYSPNTHSNTKINGAMEAFEALNLATINVVSGGMMVAGGSLWAFDISSLEDMRRKIRGGLGVDGTGRSEQSAEEEFEEWLATVLARKDEKARKRGEHGHEEKRTNERGSPR